MNLEELNFVVDTTQLKEADLLLGKLSNQVNNFNNSTGGVATNLNNVTTAATQAQQAVTGVGTGGGRGGNSAAIRSVTDLITKLSTEFKFLAEGATTGEASILRLATTMGASADEMEKIKKILSDKSKLNTNPFDNAIGATRLLEKELEKLQLRAELNSRGIQMTTSQLAAYSRIATEVQMQMVAAGKKMNENGQFANSADQSDFVRRVAEERKAAEEMILTTNKLAKAEKDAQDQAKLSAKIRDDFTRANEKYLLQEEHATDAVQKGNDALARRIELRKQGYSKSESSLIMRAEDSGYDMDLVHQAIAAERQLAEAKKKTVNANEQKVKSEHDMKAAALGIIAVTEAESDAAEKLTRKYSQMVQARTALMQEGYSAGEATKIVSLRDRGVDDAVIMKNIEAQRALSKTTDGTSASARQQAAAFKYLMQIQNEVEESTKEYAQTMDGLGIQKMAKFRDAVKMAGGEIAKHNIDINKLEQGYQNLLKTDIDRKVQNLGRAMSVQMGDVGISLAGGQNPLTVLLQQGDQIRAAIQQSQLDQAGINKAMKEGLSQIATSAILAGKAVSNFLVSGVMDTGKALAMVLPNLLGFGERIDVVTEKLKLKAEAGHAAAKAMLVLRTVILSALGTSVLAAVVAVASLAVGLKQVYDEQVEMVKVLNLTGGALGMTSNQASMFGKSMEDAGMSTAKALDTIAAAAKAGNITQSEIRMVTEAAIELEKWGGVAIEETVKQFSKLKDKPVEALIEVAKTTGLVSPAVIQLADELEKQGKKSEAAALVMTEYSRVTKTAIAGMKEDYTDFAKFMIELGDGISRFWDKNIRSIWRESKLETAQGKIEAAEAQLSMMQRGMLTSKSDIDTQKKLISDLYLEYGKLLNATKQDANAKNVAVTAANNLNAALKLEEGLQGEREGMLVKINKHTQDYIRLTGEAEKLTKAGGKANLDAAAAAERRAKAELDTANKLAEDLAKKDKKEKKPKESAEEKFMNKLTEQLSDLRIRQTKVTEETTAAERILADAMAESKVSYDKLPATFRAAFEAGIKEQSQIEKNTRATKEATEARKKWQAEYDKAVKKSDEHTKAMFDEYDRQIDLTASVRESAEAVMLEGSMITATDEARKRAIQTMKIQAEYAKELREIEKNPQKYGDAYSMEDAKAAAYERMMLKMKSLNTEIANDAAKKLYDSYMQVANGLTDAFWDIFEGGGGSAAKKIRNLIIAELKKPITVAIKPIMENIAGNASGFIASMFNGGNAPDGSQNAGSSYLSGVNSAKNVYDWGSKVYSGYTNGGMQGAWNAGTGGIFGGSSLATNTGAYTSMANGNVLAAYGVEGAGATTGGVTGTTTSAGAGTSLGTVALWAAAIYLGYKRASKDWDMGFRRDQARDVANTTWGGKGLFGDVGPMGGIESTKANILSKLGFSDKWADLLSGSTAVAALFGRAAPRVTDQGVSGTFGAKGFSGQSYVDVYQKGGLFRKSKSETITGEVDKELDNLLDSVSKNVYDKAIEFGKNLGLNVDVLKGVNQEVKISLTNKSVKELSEKYGEDLSKPFEELSEVGKNIAMTKEFADAVQSDLDANKASIEAAAAAFGNNLVSAFSDQIKEYATYGETTLQTVERLSTALTGANDILKNVNLTLFQTSLAGADAAEDFIALFGSLDALSSAVGFYYENFFSQEERMNNNISNMQKVFKELGVTMPETEEGFRALVEAADGAGDRETVAKLLAIAPVFKEVKDAVDEMLQPLRELQAEGKELGIELMSLKGDTEGAKNAAKALATEGMTQAEKAQWEYNEALREQIETLKELQSLIPNVMEKLNPEGATDMKYNDIAKTLLPIVGGSMEQLGNALRNIDSKSIYESALALYNMEGATDETRLAIVKAADSLFDLRTAAEDANRAILEKELTDMETEFGDLGQAAKILSGETETLVDKWMRNREEIKELQQGLDELLGTVKPTELQKLEKIVEMLNSVSEAIIDVNSQIFEAKTRKVSQSSVDLMKTEESRLFNEIASGNDPAGAAKKLTSLMLNRIKMEAELKAGITEKESEARKTQIEALEKQIDLAEKLRDVTESIKEYAAELRYGDLSAFNPTEQLNAARTEYERILTKAVGGDVEFMSKLQGASQAYLQEAQQYFGGATSDYAAVFQSVLGSVDGVAATPVTDIELLQKQLTKLEELEAAFEKTSKDIVDTSELEVAGLSMVDAALKTREDKLEAEKVAQVTVIEGVIAQLKVNDKTLTDSVEAQVLQYQEIRRILVEGIAADIAVVAQRITEESNK